MSEFPIHEQTSDPVVDLALDTIKKGKQALVFVNTKRSAEKVAEDIAKKAKLTGPHLKEMAHIALKALSRPTKQCERLAYCLERGVAFHHAGLSQKQRELVEDAFRDKKIPIIACTPTLAAGVDLPAFRTIIRDLRRFGQRGLSWIPVLEYLQMAGRAGRPSYDSFGEAIAIADTDAAKDKIIEQYIFGEPEDIQSKLAVEPVLRTYVLSLISSGFISSKETLYSFFGKTFWAHQFQDMPLMRLKLDQMTAQLQEWKFLQPAEGGDFVPASAILSGSLEATQLGKRVAELYLDPLTARYLLDRLLEVRKKPEAFSFLHMISRTLELRPLLTAKAKDVELLDDAFVRYHDCLFEKEPNPYDPEFEDFEASMKTALFLQDWIDEKDEEFLLEKFDIRPGEVNAKLSIADWLLFSSEELLKIERRRALLPDIEMTRMRLKYGAKEELFPLLRLRNIGRVRARRLFNNSIKDIGQVKAAPIATLSQLLGEGIAKSVKEQVGEGIKELSPRKRKGQMALEKYKS